ncbi:unnamed protein product, partial [Brassica oleracea]
MANFNLASLPPSMLHEILSKVATTSIRDFGSARVAFPGFNAVGREDHFYKSADLIFLNDWTDEVNAVRTFKLRCYQLGNPEAIYLQVPTVTLIEMKLQHVRSNPEGGRYKDGTVTARSFQLDHPPNWTDPARRMAELAELVACSIQLGHPPSWSCCRSSSAIRQAGLVQLGGWP